MAILKKIRASTLIETMVATVLIIIIFMVASLVLNNILANKFNNYTKDIVEKMEELEYKFNNDLLQLPYYEDWDGWNIDIEQEFYAGKTYTVIKSKEGNSQKKLTSYIAIER